MTTKAVVPEGFLITEAQKAKAIERATREPRRLKDGYICIGGIDTHGECYGHGPVCPYCIQVALEPSAGKAA